MIFAVNLLIMLGWAAATGDFSTTTLAGGFAVGFAALWLVRGLFGENRYHARAFGAVKLFVRFNYELLKSSLGVAAYVLNPFAKASPRIVRVPLDAESDIEIMVTANLISLTPGTLSIDVVDDRETLLVHAMFADDPEATVADLKSTLEQPILEALR